MDPNEFHQREAQHGGILERGIGLRISKPMDTALANLSWETRADKSVIVRQAIHEFFERRGVNTLIPS